MEPWAKLVVVEVRNMSVTAKAASAVTQSQLLSRLAQDSQYFYRILPYAEAIGLGAVLARTLGNTELEQCDWYQEQQPLPRTAAGFYSHLQEALALLELSIRK